MFATTPVAGTVIGDTPEPAQIYSGWNGWGPHTCRSQTVPASTLTFGEVIELPVPAQRGVEFWIRSLHRTREGLILVGLHDGCGRNEWTFHPAEPVVRIWTWRLP